MRRPTFFVETGAGRRAVLRATGKRLPKRVTEMRSNSTRRRSIFGEDGTESAPHLLIVRIQPEEGISLKFLSSGRGRG